VNIVVVLKNLYDLLDGWFAFFMLILSITFIIYYFLSGFNIFIKLGRNLKKKKIVIFAESNNFNDIKTLLTDTHILCEKNIEQSCNDLKKYENYKFLIVCYEDYRNKMNEILNLKKDGAVLIIYDKNKQIPLDDFTSLGKRRNVIVTNFYGRLLNDILVSFMLNNF
jgi:hypothetical protein